LLHTPQEPNLVSANQVFVSFTVAPFYWCYYGGQRPCRNYLEQ